MYKRTFPNCLSFSDFCINNIYVFSGEISLNGVGGVSVKKSVGEVIRVADSNKHYDDADQYEYPIRDTDRHSNRSGN